MKIGNLLLGLSLLLSAVTAQAAYSDRKDVKQFISRVAKEHNLDKQQLTALFKGVKKQRKVLKAMAKPAEGLPWYRYRRIFLTEERIDNGVNFWQENEAILQRAEQEYGVPAEMIVAIIGVETFYGQRWGTLPVLDTLVTLAFDYPKRAKFFTKELEQFLLLTEQEQLERKELVGSYAGAMGMPQFISSSYRSYAIDFDGDGKRDLWNSRADVIGSVANYFSLHGWRKGEAVTQQLQPDNKAYKKLFRKGLEPKLTLKQVTRAGFAPEPAGQADERFTITAFELEKGEEVWLGRQNFYVITRYNHSPLYAMAAYQLSQEIKARHQATTQAGAN